MNRSVRQAVASLRKAKRYGTVAAYTVAVEAALRLLSPPKAAPTKSLPKHLQSSKPARQVKHRMSTKEIRAAVMARAGGQCEGCRATMIRWRLVMDHFEGGSGRRRQRQSVETCWALCEGPLGEGCNGERTRNEPSAAYWNERFKEHCGRYGYVFHPHVVHAQVPAPQAPRAVSGGEK